MAETERLKVHLVMVKILSRLWSRDISEYRKPNRL